MRQGLDFVANIEKWSRGRHMSSGAVAVNSFGTSVRGATGILKPTFGFPVKTDTETNTTFCHEKPIMGVIGATEGRVSIPLAGLMGLYSIPMISYLTTAPTLSDINTYPSFYRTIPSDEKLIMAMADLVKHFNWNYISVITTDNEYGREGHLALKSRLIREGVCFARSDLYDPTFGRQHIVNIISALKRDESENAMVIILFMNWRYAKLFLYEAHRQGLEGKTWLLSQAWSATHEILQLPANLARGIIGMSLPSQLSRARQSDFLKYMLKQHLHRRARYNPWLPEYARTKLKCNLLGSGTITGCRESDYDASLKNCSVNLTLKDLLRHETLSVTVNAANAILTLIEAMDMAIDMDQETLALNKWFTHETLNRYVSQVDFRGAGDVTVKFDANGDIVGAKYHIFNIQEYDGDLEVFIIGKWEMKQGPGELTVRDDKIQWNNGTRPASRCSNVCLPGYIMRRSPSVCCWDCKLCPKGTISSTRQSTTCNKCDQFFHTNSNQSECLPNAEMWVHQSVMRIPITIMGSVGVLSFLVITGILWVFRDLVLIRRTELKYTFLLVVFSAQLYPFTHSFRPTTTVCTVHLCLLMIPAALLPVVLISQTKPTLRTSGRILRRLLHKNLAKRFVQMYTFCIIGIVSLSFCMLFFWKGLPSVDRTVEQDGGDITFLSCEDPLSSLGLMPLVSQVTLTILAAYFFERENGETHETRDSTYNGVACYILLLSAAVLLPVYLTVTYKQAKIILLTLGNSIGYLTITCLKFLPQLYDIFIKKDRRVLETVITLDTVTSQLEDPDVAQKDSIL
ncbi:metabotropic glutamate receptor 1-like [Lineus longissimus]|uniref:metabotropic glutamate receptor 1-like n=1 Tax=Lineus longissimus TaxID=88925 RepID=UPI00315D63BF